MLAARLLKAGRLFMNTYHNQIRAAAAQGMLSMLDSRSPSNEPRWSFYRRLHQITENYLWLFFLQEKDDASRIGEPLASDLYYPYPRYRSIQVVQSNYPCGKLAMQDAIRSKAAIDRYSAGMIVAFWVMDRNRHTLASFFACMDIPMVLELQHSYFTLTPEEDLQSCSS
ncbi:hypothetical protein VNI00_006107 [Paramarasmius palmivorus]|uniref:Uncharacterized protein n=1 Tax=Paramarasmius palmivorus TaxID=297713 RepID=A0AAW0D9W0_9AGAR